MFAIQDLANPERGSPSWVSKSPNVKASRNTGVMCDLEIQEWHEIWKTEQEQKSHIVVPGSSRQRPRLWQRWDFVVTQRHFLFSAILVPWSLPAVSWSSCNFSSPWKLSAPLRPSSGLLWPSFCHSSSVFVSTWFPALKSFCLNYLEWFLFFWRKPDQIHPERCGGYCVPLRVHYL